MTKVHEYFVIRGLFICKFAYSHFNIGKNDNFLVKNVRFICKFRIRGPKWRNGMYLPQITRETCIAYSLWCKSWAYFIVLYTCKAGSFGETVWHLLRPTPSAGKVLLYAKVLMKFTSQHTSFTDQQKNEFSTTRLFPSLL